MLWLLLALLSQALYAVSNLIDVNLVDRYVKNTITLTIISNLFESLPILAVLFIGISMPSPFVLFIALLSGALGAFVYLPYFKAVALDDATSVNALWKLSYIFIPFIAFFLLKESLSSIQYLAFALILCGSFLISIRDFKKIKFSKVLLLMGIASFINALYSVLYKFVFMRESFWNGFFWIILGGMLGTLAMFFIKDYGNQFFNTIKKLKKDSYKIILINGAICIAAMIASMYAINLGPVSLVKIIGGFKPVFILCLALIFSPIFPSFFREKLDRKNLILKIVSIVLMLVGIVMIQPKVKYIPASPNNFIKPSSLEFS